MGGRDYAHLGGPHKLAWHWTARELVEYKEWTYSDGRLQQTLSRAYVKRGNRMVLDGRAEANVVYEASSNLVEYPPGYPGSDPPNPLGACTAKLMTNGFRVTVAIPNQARNTSFVEFNAIGDDES